MALTDIFYSRNSWHVLPCTSVWRSRLIIRFKM